MKNKTFKKSLAMFLSFLMVLTSLVFVVPEIALEAEAGYANEDASIVVNRNKNTMSGLTTLDTGVSTIYGAFPYDDSYVTDNYYSQIYKNVLYSGTVDVNGSANTGLFQFASNWTGSNSTTIYFYHADTVLMYDGTTQPSTGVMFSSYPEKTGSWSANSTSKSAYISSGGNGLEFTDYWHAYDGRLNFTYTYWRPSDGSTEAVNYSSTITNSSAQWTRSDNHYYANILHFTGSMGDNEYKRVMNPVFAWYGSNGGGDGDGTRTTGSSVNTFYVINYVPLKAAINEAITVQNLITANYAKYTPESVAKFASLANALMATHPNRYTWSSNTATTVNNYEANAKAAVDAWNAWYDNTGLEVRKTEIVNEGVFSFSDWAYSTSSTGSKFSTLDIDIDAGTITMVASDNDAYTNMSGSSTRTATNYYVDVSAENEYIVEYTTSTANANARVLLFFYNSSDAHVGTYGSYSNVTAAAGTQYYRVTKPTGATRMEIRFGADTGDTVKYSNIAIYPASSQDTRDVQSWSNRTYRTVYNYGDVLANVATPSRTGYTFNDWLADLDGNGSGTDANDAPVKNYYGQAVMTQSWNVFSDWTENQYTIHFDGNGATSGSMSDMSMNYTDSKALTANAFTKTGYTFAGWSTTAGGSVAYANNATVSKLSATNGATVTLYAVWSPITYNVQYVTNGADEEISSQSAAYDTSFNLPTPTKTGYTFVGWYTASDFSGTSYSAGQNVSNLATAAGATVTLYAKWSPITYTISFDANGGTAVADVTASYDTEYTLPSTTQTGKVLTGWMDAAGTIHSAGTKVKNLTTTAGDTVTFTAQWDVATYTVTFMHWDNVTVLDTQTVEYGGTATYGGGTPAVTYDESNHFTWNNTWTGASLTNVTENRTVLAGYTSTPHTYSTHTSDDNATVTDGVASGTHDDKCDCGYVKADQACTFESVTTDATCTVDGSIVYTCSDCGNTVTETIDASHDFTAEIADEKYLHTPGSCTVGAFYYYACSACGDSSNDDSLKWQAAAPGHKFEANSDGTNINTSVLSGACRHNYTCLNCTAKGVVVNGAQTANAWENCADGDTTLTDPTCTKDGYYTCNICSQTWAADGATGHTDPEDTEADAAYWETVTPATCETAGSKKALCKVCGAETGTTADIDKTGHAYTSEVTTKATCEADGVRTYTCPNTGCETPSYTETIAKRGHSWGDWQTVTEATFTQDGLAERYCQNTTATDTHEACSAREEQVLTAGDDTTSPTGEIKWGTSVWNSFLSAITFGNYTNYDVTLEITAEDAESGVAKIEYFVAEGAYADADALEAAATWTEYDATSKLTVPAVDAQAIVVYAKLTNVDGDIAYINTDGIVFDTTAPVITLSGTGNADTKEYCGAVTVTVTDDNLGEVGNGTYTISTVAPNSQQYENARTTFELTGMAGEWEVTAKDLAGNKTVMTVTVNADHTWATTDTTNLATEATCTAPATYYKVCSVCGAVSDTETFESGDKLGHLEGDWVVTDKADCSTAGSKSIYCTRVNAGETEACGAVLDTEEIPVRAHTWSTTENDGYVVVSEATCTATGLETRTCVNEETDEYDACEHSESRDIPMIAHDFSDKTDKSAKVSDAACTIGTIYKVGCSACDALSDSLTWEDTDALGHSFTSGVYDYDTATDKHSQKCANCDVYSAEEACVFGDWAHVEGTNKHKQVCVCGNFNEGVHADAEPVVTAPTCTTDGYTTNVCDVCEYKWTTNPTTKTGHNFTGEYKINADGTHTRKCVNTDCNEYGDSTVCAYGSWTADAENRQHYRKCVCGRTEPIDCATTAHSTSYDATCLANAKTVYECNVCTNEWTKETANTQKDHSYTGAYSPGNAATDTHQRQCVNGCKGWADEACSFTNNFKASTNEGTTHKHTAECACGNVETLDCFGLPTGMTDATCTTNAYMNYECEDCGNKWSVEQESTKLGHSYTTYETLVAATCKAPGTKVSTCDNGCGTKTTLPIQIDKNNHTGGTEVTGVVTATCQKTGYTGDKKCLGCGTTLETGSIVPLADHDWDNGKTIREANCIGTGVKLYTCKTEGCTKTEEREIAIDPTNHANVQTGVGLDPTCTEPGYTGATECTACHTTIKNGTPIAPLGHEISAWEIIQMPSEDGTQPGIAERCCIRCGGEKETRTDFYIDDVHRVIFHNYDGVRLTQPRYYITGDKAIRPTETPVRVEDDQYTYEFKGWDFSDAELNYVQKEMPVVAQYNAIEKSYAVTFIDASGKVIQTLPGNTPYSQIADSYTGETPTMPSDGVKNYTFSGWGINCDYETGTATVEPVFVGTPIEVEEEEPNEGIFGWLIRWIKQLLASIGINL